MYNLSDEEFDHLCRNAAENPGAEIPVDGWERLKRQLDRDMPEDEGKRRRSPFWIPFLVFLPFSLLYWLDPSGAFITGHDGSPAAAVTNSRAPQSAKVPLQHSPGENHKSEIPARNIPGTTMGKKDIAPDQVYVDVMNKAFGHPAAPPVQARKLSRDRLRRGLLPERSGNEQAGIHHEQNQDIKQTNPTALPSAFPDVKNADPSTQPSNNHEVNILDSSRQSSALPEVKNADPSRQLSAVPAAGTGVKEPQDGGDADGKANTLKGDKNENPSMRPGTPSERKKGFALSLVAGPDWSNVSFAAADKTGFNAGVLAEYRFRKRWTVQGGLMYSRKHYTAMGDGSGGYPGYDPSNPNLKMEKVQANCYMWDIPVNIRFDVIAKKKHGAYAGMGISSYLMKKEDLHYYYTYNNSPRYKAWVNTNPSMYWFSILNLFAGYEYRVLRDFSVRLEPFMKVPLRPVGSGKIQLNSIGMLLGLTYSPFQKNNPSTKK